MIVNLSKLQDVSKKVLDAIDNTSENIISEFLEIEIHNKQMTLNITNKEYFVSVTIAIADGEDNFRAVVDAKLFLNLISKLTTENVEITLSGTSVIVKGNGVYKLALLCNSTTSEVVELHKIDIENVTTSFNIDSKILNNILIYNTRGLKDKIVDKSRLKEINKIYCIDECGCITFVRGACVNSFTLEQPIKLMLEEKIVRLFKLFTDGTVKFTTGYDQVGNQLVQKIRFENSEVAITALVNSDAGLINSFPARQIRERANAVYPYTVVINRTDLVNTLTRLMLFKSSESIDGVGKLIFNGTSVILEDYRGSISEQLNYVDSYLTDTYEAFIELENFKMILEGCSEKYVTISFGDHKAIVLTRGTVKNVIPELRLS